jgi:hypothetical protein
MSTGPDLAVGGAIGALGATQGFGLPGMILVGVGYDLVVASAYGFNPQWFPGNEQLTLRDVVTTAIGTAIGWSTVRALMPAQTNPAGDAGIGALAMGALSFAAIPFGRAPGQLPRVR